MADFSSEKSQKKLLKYKKQLRDLDRERKYAKEKADQEKKKLNEHKRTSKKKTPGGATLKGKAKTVSGGKPDWVKGSVGGDLVPSKGTSIVPQGKVMGYDVAPVDDFINTTAKRVPPKGPSAFMKGAAKVGKIAGNVAGPVSALASLANVRSAGEGSDIVSGEQLAASQSPEMLKAMHQTEVDEINEDEYNALTGLQGLENAQLEADRQGTYGPVPEDLPEEPADVVLSPEQVAARTADAQKEKKKINKIESDVAKETGMNKKQTAELKSVGKNPNPSIRDEYRRLLDEFAAEKAEAKKGQKTAKYLNAMLQVLNAVGQYGISRAAAQAQIAGGVPMEAHQLAAPVQIEGPEIPKLGESLKSLDALRSIRELEIKEDTLKAKQRSERSEYSLNPNDPLNRSQAEEFKALGIPIGENFVASKRTDKILNQYRLAASRNDKNQERKLNRELREDQDHQRKVTGFSKRMEKTPIQPMAKSMASIDAFLKKHYKFDMNTHKEGDEIKEMDIEGMGAFGKYRPDMFLTTKDLNFRQNVQTLANMILKERSGSAVTPTEYDRMLAEIGGGNLSNERDIIAGLMKMNKDIRNRVRSIEAIDPRVIKSHKEYGGVLMSDMLGMKKKDKTGTKEIKKKQYSASRDKTKIIYADGTEELVDGRL